MNFIILILSLPTSNATVRMRAWRMLKTSGAAVLHDGVYLLPEHCRETLESTAVDVRSGGGKAMVLRVEQPEGEDFAALFDRAADYAALLTEIGNARATLSVTNVAESVKQTRKLRKAFSKISEIDFFPGEAHRQIDAALQELEDMNSRILSPDEPQSLPGIIPRVHASDYQGRLWATRRRPWVDRLASAWLIRRFIDPQAQFLWLTTPAACPPTAIGFDFDGATFTHVGSKVTFEVLMESFAQLAPGLMRMAALVHYLDVGGVQPAEARGLECILSGLRESVTDDDLLLAAVCTVFDALLTVFAAPTVAESGGGKR
ncbi:MAG: chromate resistance protein [Gammaproteobacteria bacterium]|nr:chromate resistance protein [Gammaproteobacteria bacterium]